MRPTRPCSTCPSFDTRASFGQMVLPPAWPCYQARAGNNPCPYRCNTARTAIRSLRAFGSSMFTSTAGGEARGFARADSRLPRGPLTATREWHRGIRACRKALARGAPLGPVVPPAHLSHIRLFRDDCKYALVALVHGCQLRDNGSLSTTGCRGSSRRRSSMDRRLRRSAGVAQRARRARPVRRGEARRLPPARSSRLRPGGRAPRRR